jgi:hypothetical protein
MTQDLVGVSPPTGVIFSILQGYQPSEQKREDFVTMELQLR